MVMRFTSLVVASVLVLPTIAQAPQPPRIAPDQVCEFPRLFVDSCFSVHGRLGAYNGGPAFRIWVIGTTRILGLGESQGCVLPAALDTLVGIEDKFVYADFVVRPL